MTSRSADNASRSGFALPAAFLGLTPAQRLAGVAKVDIPYRAAGKFTFVAGYTNGYLFYLPTEAQRKNTGYAQEGCDCRVAPEGQMRCWRNGQSSSTFQCRDSDNPRTRPATESETDREVTKNSRRRDIGMSSYAARDTTADRGRIQTGSNGA